MVKMGPAPATLVDVLEKLIVNSFVNENDCWLWRGYTTNGGYGVINWQGKQTLIHRFVYSQFIGELPEVVRHKCDNTRCWNYKHLEGGTQADNVRDMVERGRHLRGTSHGMAKLNDAAVLEIREAKQSAVQQAIKFDVALSLIHKIRRRENWKHV